MQKSYYIEATARVRFHIWADDARDAVRKADNAVQDTFVESGLLNVEHVGVIIDHVCVSDVIQRAIK